MKTKRLFKKILATTSALVLLVVSGYVLSGVVKAAAAIDTFTDTAGTLLENHTSDSGNTWTKNSAVSGGGMVITDANRVRGGSATAVIYVNDWVPASPDYEVSTDVYFASVNYAQTGIGGRTGTTAFTGYYALLVQGEIRLYRGGNVAPLGSYAVSPTVGSTYALKLSMQGNDITVYWDGAPVIAVTVSGSNIISTAGFASVYSQGAFTNSTGPHLDNFKADGDESPLAPLTAGVLSESSHTANSATLAWTASAGGTAPVTSQLQRSVHDAGSWSDVGGATSSPATNTGLSLATSYDYRVAYSDATPSTVYSNVVTVTTDSAATTTHAIQAAELWDNGYDNISAPRQSAFSRFVFTTDAANVAVNGTTTIYGSFPNWAHLGVRIDGVEQSPLAFTGSGARDFTINLGAAGTTRTIEIIAGLQTKPSSTVLGTFVNSITYPDSATFTVSPASFESRVLVYGDSISVGANSTNPEYQGYVPLLRNDYDYNIMLEGWGYRSLHEDANSSGLRSSFVNRISGYMPSIIYLAIGTNDYGLNKWNANNFGNAYAAVLDDIHSSLPSVKVICQTPLVRGNESANSFGNTLNDYRNQIVTACSSRSWATLVDGAAFLTTSDLVDGVHPSTAGFAKYAKRIAPLLASPAFTVTGPTTGLANQASEPYTVDLAKANFMGDQTITLTASDGTITATAAGGSVSGNGTGTVIVSPANNATNFSLVYTPTSSGSKTLTFTNGQSWEDPPTTSYIVLAETDADDDGIDDAIEDGAPNNGDGNNDSIPDAQQANVASFVNPITNEYAVLAVDEDCEITNVAINPESSNATQDTNYQYSTGLMDFTLGCQADGHVAEITQYYYGLTSTDLILRKYNPNTAAYFTVEDSVVEHQTIGDQSVVVVSYQIADGGVLDMDNEENGTIVDPVGLASTADNDDAPTVAGNDSSPSDDGLADTGQDTRLLVFASVFVLLVGGVGSGYIFLLQRTP